MGNRTPLVLVLAVAAEACSPYLHSPPARTIPLETAAALPKGDFGFQAAGGGGSALWGPKLGGGTVQARFGVGRNFEVAGEGSALRIGRQDDEWSSNARATIFAGRTGFKYSPTSWFAVQAGFGGGTSAAGGFISPDGGVIFSYQNKVAIPFFAGGFYYSHPVNPKPVVFFDDRNNVEVLYPDRTLGGYMNFGVRIPFSRDNADLPRTALMLAYRIVFASHSEYLGSNVYQEQYTDTYHLGVVSLEFVLEKQPDKSGGKGRRWKLR